MIKIALNGGTPKSINPNVPTTVEEYARELEYFVSHGLKYFHIHFRDENGADTLEQDVIKPQWDALKEMFPGIKIGVGSPLLNGRTSEMRLDQVGRWEGWKPDYISVNVPEEGCREFVALLREKDVPMEISCFEPEDAHTFVENNYIEDTHRLLIEVSGAPDGPATVDKAKKIYEYLHALYPDVECVIHGEDIFTWDVIKYCRDNDLSWRIGMEDISCDMKGREIKTNAELYEYAMSL